MSESLPHAPRAVLVYDGRISELYRIFLINLLLTIVTFGIWRFWATTRLRRYIWSRTSSGGERFEYDGTGMQLFIGFLLAIGLFFGLFLVAGVLRVFLHKFGPVISYAPLLLAELVIVVLGLGAPFSAQRYRLNHTIWRGIRGGMEGSMITYGLHALGLYLAAGLTVYQLLPLAWLRLLERRINASSFGTLRFTAHGRIGPLYIRFLFTFLATIFFACVVFGTFFLLERGVFYRMPQTRGPLEQEMLMRPLILPMIVAFVVFGIGVALISSSFQAAFYRHVTSHSTLGPLSFDSDVTTGDIFTLIGGNLLILLFTLGFGLPVVIHRNAKFFTAHLLATGALDLSQIGQSPLPVSRFGEGMFQALDAGAGAL